MFQILIPMFDFSWKDVLASEMAGCPVKWAKRMFRAKDICL